MEFADLVRTKRREAIGRGCEKPRAKNRDTEDTAHRIRRRGLLSKCHFPRVSRDNVGRREVFRLAEHSDQLLSVTTHGTDPVGLFLLRS
jgi:hypothetical protein